MKRILFFFAVSISLNSYAQQFSFQMYFKDAIGNRDTLTLGYDTAATKLIDAAFGEVNIIGVPLDSIFEVRITDESVWGGQQQGTFHTKKQITYYNCDSPLYNIQSIDIKAKHWPVTATWNKAIFNDSCRDWSYFSSFIGDLGGSSNLGMARLANKDSVIFTTNADPGWFGFFYYVNNANDTISVFLQSFADSITAIQSLNELAKTKGIKVFPNPSTNSISVSLDENFAASNTICLYNIYGQLVLSTSQKENIDVANLPSGLYLIRVADKYERTQTVRFQKI
jgi:hypothetical protein